MPFLYFSELKNRVRLKLEVVFFTLRMIWSGHVAGMREKRDEYRILLGRPEGRRSLRRPRRRWENNIKIDLQEVGRGMEPPGSIRSWKFLD
jgi:hypothetical protein